ncbi:MAG: ATP-dependent Clp protease proteolytic subunit [Clostridia bacterium]|nr:ATP-dependent Clp protease proteolytic subunit [Clostridia bacterium]
MVRENNENSMELDEDKLNSIEKNGDIITRRDGISIHSLSIIGQVEGHYILGSAQKATKYEHIIPLLVSVEESEDVDGLLILLNTMGGDVEAGLALAELIASMSKPTVSIVLGGGHSIGVPLAVSAKRSFIVPSATMTIHPVRINGLVIGAPQTYYYFEQMQDRILDFISDHSNADKEEIKKLMMRTDQIATDMGSVIDGRQAVDAGLIDEVGGLSQALDALKKMIREGKEEKVAGEGR